MTMKQLQYSWGENKPNIFGEPAFYKTLEMLSTFLDISDISGLYFLNV